MMRSMKRICEHTSLLEMLIVYPKISIEVLEENGIDTRQTPEEIGLSRREERKLVTKIKEKVNGSDHS